MKLKMKKIIPPHCVVGRRVGLKNLNRPKCTCTTYYCIYRGSPPYAFFGTWKKPCYMKLVLVGLYCGPLLTLIPPLTRT